MAAVTVAGPIRRRKAARCVDTEGEGLDHPVSIFLFGFLYLFFCLSLVRPPVTSYRHPRAGPVASAQVVTKSQRPKHRAKTNFGAPTYRESKCSSRAGSSSSPLFARRPPFSSSGGTYWTYTARCHGAGGFGSCSATQGVQGSAPQSSRAQTLGPPDAARSHPPARSTGSVKSSQGPREGPR